MTYPHDTLYIICMFDKRDREKIIIIKKKKEIHRTEASRMQLSSMYESGRFALLCVCVCYSFVFGMKTISLKV